MSSSTHTNACAGACGRFFVGGAALALIVTATTASAQETPPPPTSDSDAQSDELLVLGRRFIDVDTTGATRLPLPIERVPQSISLINREVMESLNAQDLSILADYSAGTSQSGSYAGFLPQLKMRGFVQDDLYGYKVNGFRYGRYLELDDSLIDRIEVIRGPSSAVYGIGNPGGVINYVTKSAPNATVGRVEGSMGSHNTIGGQAEFGGPIGDATRILITTSGRKGDSHVNFASSDYLSAGLVLEYDITADLKLKALGYRITRSATTNDGIPLYSNGSIPNVSRSLFLGDSDRNRSTQKGSLGQLQLTYDAGKALSLGVTGSYQDTDLTIYQTYPFTLASNGAFQLRNFNAYQDTSVVTAEAYARWEFDLFGQTGNNLLASVGFDRLVADRYTRNATFSVLNDRVASIFDSQQAIVDRASRMQNTQAYRRVYSRSQSLVGTVQTLLKPLEHLDIIAGVAVNKPEFESTTQVFKYDTQASYRVGATYDFGPLSIYGSWSTSFIPQRLLGLNEAPLDPITGEQLEGGVKAKLFGNRLLVTASVFTIDQANSPELIPGTQPERYRAVGGVRHRGVELEVIGNVTPELSVYASFDLLEAKIRRSTNPLEVGRKRPFIPTGSAGLFLNYTFGEGSLKGLRTGAGVRHVNSAPTSVSGATRDLPGYTVADAVLSYSIGQVDLRLNFNNVFDKTYRLASYDAIEYGLLFGDPRSVLLTVAHSF